MEIQGKIIEVFPEQSGVSQKGNGWRIQPFLLETHGQYQKKVYIEIFGEDRIKNCNLVKDQDVTVGIDIESQEFRGRWFTQVRAWKVEQEDKNPSVIKPDTTFDASQDATIF